ncbi:hypothetical protein GCM10022216_24010 [Sphingobacterium kyonggiense]|uniref:Uncharacterized protein n=1 Tax=Sphingobacterium kyonggiense TaxID=714075 RepID=A0ABP7YX44_9SPHI
MKININIPIVLIILSACGSIKQNDNIKVVNKGNLKVSKITKLNSVYVIEANRNDSIFTIIYPLVEGVNGEIKKGHSYGFEIKLIFPKENFISFMEVDYYQIGNYRIKLNERNHWSIYTDTTSLNTR